MSRFLIASTLVAAATATRYCPRCTEDGVISVLRKCEAALLDCAGCSTPGKKSCTFWCEGCQKEFGNGNYCVDCSKKIKNKPLNQRQYDAMITAEKMIAQRAESYP